MHKIMIRLPLGLLLYGALTVLVLASDSALETFFRGYLNERFVLHPTEATLLGDHRFDAKLVDLSPSALEKSMVH